jgi:hypothetical protein
MFLSPPPLMRDRQPLSSFPLSVSNSRLPLVVISESDVVRYTPRVNPTSRRPTGPGFDSERERQ